MRSLYFAFLAGLPLLLAQTGFPSRPEYFEPTHKLSGIGAERHEMSDLVLEVRTERMIQSQTFGIMRDPQALAGAQRITSGKLKNIFQEAAQQSGFPYETLRAISYLESWGDAKAESPAGPLGIMQISGATAKSMGLQVIKATKYRVTTERRAVRGRRGKISYRNVKIKVPYTVVVRDERLMPELAIPAAARYLASMVTKFGGLDWAVFAYHCGPGCVGEFQNLAEDTSDFRHRHPTVAQVFFGNSPAHNHEIYEAIRHHMERDYSPTYFFRISRAQQLLNLYERDPQAFKDLVEEYRYQPNPAIRAPHRLSVWLRPEDMLYQSRDDLKREQGKKLVRVLENPQMFNFEVRRSGFGAIGDDDPSDRDLYFHASPAALGTLTYISYETRRLFDAMKPKNETFVPLEVTALVLPADIHDRTLRNGAVKNEFPAHCTGQVFDLSLARLPVKERECLEFVLQDLGWDGYLGFVQESGASAIMHVGCAPASREFFTQVFQDAFSKHHRS